MTELHTTPRIAELRQHALIEANRLNFLLRTRSPALAVEAAEARSRATPETEPAFLLSKYLPTSRSKVCPQCWVAGRPHGALTIEAESALREVVRCNSCGFATTLPRDA